MKVLVALVALLCLSAGVAPRVAATEAETAAEVEAEASGEGHIDIDLVTEGEMMSDPAAVTSTTQFLTPGGSAAQLESVVLLLSGEAAVRLLRVDGEVTGKNNELTLVMTSMPSAMRRWVQSFIAGKYKKRKVSLVMKTPNTGTKKTPLQHRRIDYKGIMLREVSFPALGSENGQFKIKLVYQESHETGNVRAMGMLDVPVRSQFFKFTMKGRDGKDKTGDALGKTVFGLDGFTISRVNGFGKQSATEVALHFPTTAETLPQWQQWFTRDQQRKRHGKLTLYYWTGASLDNTEAGRGQLKVLFELHLNDLEITKLDSGEGKAVVKADNIDMSDH